jgi:AcrR family transcriptional regulator
LSKGCIYYYFSSKHEILYFILDAYMDHLLEGLEEELSKISDPASKIRFILSRHLSLYNNKVHEAKALLVDSHNLPLDYYEAIASKQKRYARILADVIYTYFEGRMDAHKTKAISYIFFGMCNSIMHWRNPEGPLSLEEISGICFDLSLGGINIYNTAAKENAG